MCQFNLLIIDKESRSDSLKKTILDIGFGYRELENENLSGQIGNDKRIILTTKVHCDCGSIVGVNHGNSLSKINIEKEKRKLRKKKWSESKIEKYLNDRLREESKKDEASELGGELEENKWLKVIENLLKQQKKIGMLFHQFDGLLEDEAIKLEKINQIPIELLSEGELRNFKENQLN